MKTYQYRISKESLLSRIPGLFPYIDYNDVGDAIIHKATDSKIGCYAKIIENMVLPSGVNLIVDNETILSENTEYSYRTLIDYYYKYRDDLDDSDTFKQFIETAIGRVKITDKNWYDEKTHDLVPEYTYLAIAKSQYTWFLKRKALCEQYEQMKADGTHGECIADYCCKCQEYERMGGDNMLSLLKELIDEAEEISEEYYGYASSNTKNATLDIHIMLTKNMSDMGVMTPMELYWIAGDEYDEGDIVVYNGNTYICTGSTTGRYNDVTEKIEFDIDNFEKIKDLHYNEDIDSDDAYGTRFKIIDRKYYSSSNSSTEIEKWEQNTDYNSGDYVVYNDTVYICNTSHTSGYTFDSSYFDETSSYYSSDEDETENDIELEGVTDSKLKSLRRFKDYINAYDEFETPDEGEDWLYYYRLGVANYNVLNDDFGNMEFIYDDADEWVSGENYSVNNKVWYNGALYKCIEKASGDGYFDYSKYERIYYYTDANGNEITSEGAECYNLYAYGDIMTNISYEADGDDNYKLIFEYIIGAHLKAVYNGYDVDDDNNKLYYFSGFEYDDTDLYHGVKHVDTYFIDADSDIYVNLISGNGDKTFEEYIADTDSFDTYKYEFSTDTNVVSNDKLIANEKYTYQTIMSEFSTTVKNEVDYSYSNIFKTDYLNGISFAPSKDVDVYISRGNAAAFDRHIKLGEIKTLEDLETYANGGFYNIEDND